MCTPQKVNASAWHPTLCKHTPFMYITKQHSLYAAPVRVNKPYATIEDHKDPEFSDTYLSPLEPGIKSTVKIS